MACDSLVRSVGGSSPRRAPAATNVLSSSVARDSTSEGREKFFPSKAFSTARKRTFSAGGGFSTCDTSSAKEQCFPDGTKATYCACDPFAEKRSHLFAILFRNTSVGAQPVPFLFLPKGGRMPFLRHGLQRISGILLLSFVCLLALPGAPGHCLVSRAGSSQQPLCASLSAERGFTAGNDPPRARLQNAAARLLFLSPPSTMPERTATEKTATSSRERLPAFLGAVSVSSHAFFSSSKQNSTPTSAVASPPRTAGAANPAVSPAAFATAPLSASTAAAPSRKSSSVASPSSAAPTETAAAATVPTFASTAASAQLRSSGSSTSLPEFDVVIVGLGVGGHAAALHAAALGLRTAVVTGGDPGGTCVNRGCVPSKALLAIAKKVKSLRNKKLLTQMGIYLQGPGVEVDPAQVAQHAKGVVEKVRGGLIRSLAAHGITSFEARGVLNGRADRVYLQSVSPTSSCASSSSGSLSPADPLPEYITARNVLLAPGSTPFVPRGVELDEKDHRVMTSDACVTLPWLPSSVCIVGAGYIGLEFMDVFSSLGSEVTLVDSGPRVLPGVDAEIAKAAERLLLQQFKERPVTLYRDALASSVKTLPPQEQRRSSGGSCSQPPLVEVQLVDVKTKEKTKTLYTDACLIATGRIPNTQNMGLESLGITLKRGGFVPVDACMRVTRYPVEAAAAEFTATGQQQVKDKEAAEVIDGLYCIGDANGQMMLAHAASAQGIAAVETIAGRPRVVNVKHIPAACFTSPEIAFVGDTEETALKEGETKGFEVGKSVSHFKANTKAVAEGEAEGLLKVLYRKDTGKLLGCHMIGMHASDLIQECATAIANDLTVQQLAFTTHTHPTLSEVVDAAWKKAVGMNAH